MPNIYLIICSKVWILRSFVKLLSGVRDLFFNLIDIPDPKK